MTATRPAPASARTSHGFTLIEVLIVLAIVGILAAIAYPSYGEHVRKTRRADAHFSLLSARQALERCRSTSYTYVGCSIDAYTPSEEGYYTLAFSEGPTPSAFELEATAVGSQANDADCPTLTIDELDDPKPEACW